MLKASSELKKKDFTDDHSFHLLAYFLLLMEIQKGGETQHDFVPTWEKILCQFYPNFRYLKVLFSNFDWKPSMLQELEHQEVLINFLLLIYMWEKWTEGWVICMRIFSLPNSICFADLSFTFLRAVFMFHSTIILSSPFNPLFFCNNYKFFNWL